MSNKQHLANHLATLTWKRLVEVAKVANGGSIGFDPNRDKPEAGYVRGDSPKHALAQWAARTAFYRGTFLDVSSKLSELGQPLPFAEPDPANIPVNLENFGVEPVPQKEAQMPQQMQIAAVEPAKPAKKAAPKPKADNKMAAVIAAIEDAMGDGVDEDAVRAIVRDELRGVKPQQIKVELPGGKVKKIEGRINPAFQDVLDVVQAGHKPLLVGPAGCGKTTLAGQVAEALDKPFSHISGSAGASEAQLVGRLLPTGEGGRFEYHPTPFIKRYTDGGCFLFDELDAFDPNMLLVVNSALSNGGFEVEARAASGLDTYVRRHKENVLIGAANTYGTGADAIYVGRFQLDAATLDRWTVIYVDYDTDLENAISPKWAGWVHSVREAAQKARMRRVVSTRMVEKAASFEAQGWAEKKIKATLLAGWSKDELNKVPA